MRFEGKVALVTGGGGAIGRASVLRFAQEGADVAVVDVNAARAQQVADEVKAMGRNALAIAADVSSAEDVVRMFETTMQALGHLDILFNNAGIGGGSDEIKDMKVEDWDRTIAINLRGIFLGCKFGMNALIESGGGAIINMSSSTAGWDTIRGGASYMSSKEAVNALTRGMALEAAPYGIRVNAVCPGIIRTTLSFDQSGGNQAEMDAYFRRFEQRIPLRRVGQPEDVAGVVAFLASDDARHMTGSLVLIDGGQTLESWSNAPDADEFPWYGKAD